MSDKFEDMNFSWDSLHISYINDFLFIEYFDSNFLSCGDMDGGFDFAESAFS
jgi:hypothetical protein